MGCFIRQYIIQIIIAGLRLGKLFLLFFVIFFPQCRATLNTDSIISLAGPTAV
jgi:hypothetical protein